MWKPCPIREFVRSPRWMTLYARAKDLNISLFDNASDLSDIQIVVLQWSEIYYYLYNEKASGAERLTDAVLDNQLLTDAWLEYDKEVLKKARFSKKDKKGLDGEAKLAALHKLNKDLPPKIMF